MRWSSVSPARRFSNGCALGSLSENYSLWFSVSPLCLCGESFFKEFHHRDTEHHRVLHREMLFRQTPRQVKSAIESSRFCGPWCLTSFGHADKAFTCRLHNAASQKNMLRASSEKRTIDIQPSASRTMFPLLSNPAAKSLCQNSRQNPER